jgi:UPF0176 protein
MDFTVILFYRYFLITNVADIKEKLQSKCEDLSLLGRILVAKEGLNGTLASDQAENIHAFIQFVEVELSVAGIDWKFSSATGESSPFRELTIKEVNELVSSGSAKDLIDSFVHFDSNTFGGLNGTGKHLNPREFHDMMLNSKSIEEKLETNNRRSDPIVIDIRNEYEYAIGHFENAVPLHTTTYAETWKALDAIVQKEGLRLICCYRWIYFSIIL